MWGIPAKTTPNRGSKCKLGKLDYPCAQRRSAEFRRPAFALDRDTHLSVVYQPQLASESVSTGPALVWAGASTMRGCLPGMSPQILK